MRIEYMADHRDAIPMLARWHQDEWASRTPHLSLGERIARLENLVGRHEIPTTFVALVEDRPAGFACLVAHDMETRRYPSPWLASVLVAPPYRRRGIGSALSEWVAEEARDLGANDLFLYTFNKEAFYTRLGWKVLARTDYLGASVAVMVRHLAGHLPYLNSYRVPSMRGFGGDPPPGEPS